MSGEFVRPNEFGVEGKGTGQTRRARGRGEARPVPHPPGLGDNQNTYHWWVDMKNYWYELSNGIFSDWNYMEKMCERFYNLTNGTHTVGHAIGWDAGQGGLMSSPFWYEDSNPPLGDGTAGSGYARYREMAKFAGKYNGEMGNELASTVNGNEVREEFVRKFPRARAIDANGEWVTYTPEHGERFLYFSIHNMYRFYRQEWNELIDSYATRVGMTHSAFLDTPYSPGNQDPNDPEAWTTPDEEARAYGTLADYLWNNLAISSWSEYFDPFEYQDQPWSVPWYSHPYFGRIWGLYRAFDFTDEDLRDLVKNRMVVSSLTLNDHMRDIVWGSERGTSADNDPVIYLRDNLDDPSGDYTHRERDYRMRFYRNCLPYLYMQKFTPSSFVDDDTAFQVRFTGPASELHSTYYKSGAKKHTYELTEVEEDRTVVLADGATYTGIMDNPDYDPKAYPDGLAYDPDKETYCRFVPQVGAGLKIIAYSKVAREDKAWVLPSAWDGIATADLYSLTVDREPEFSRSVAIDREKHELRFTMAADAAYVIVPQGNAPTAAMEMFSGLSDGDTVSRLHHDKTGSSIGFYPAGDFAMKVQGVGPGSAAGGFGSNCLYAEMSSAGTAVVEIAVGDGDGSNGILHSVRIGNKGGRGDVSLTSSNPLNPPAALGRLPEAPETMLLETNWKYPEAKGGRAELAITNDAMISNVLLDDFRYSKVLVQEDA